MNVLSRTKGYTTAGVLLRAAFFRDFLRSVIFLVQINGQKVDCAGKTIAAYLQEQGYDNTRIAIEKNGEIVPKRTFADTVLSDGDVLEVVRFVGGG